MKLQVERMRIKSPISGKIEKIYQQVGESVDGLQKVIRVVKTDVLWIDVPVPLEQARDLKCGQRAQVSFPAAGGDPVEAKIIHVAAVADAASDTLTIRVEVANASGRPAGEHVKITFPHSAKDDAAKTQEPKPNPAGQNTTGESSKQP